MPDLLEALRKQRPSEPYGAYTGNRNQGTTHFPGYFDLSIEDRVIANEVHEGSRASALLTAEGVLYLLEHVAAGAPFDGQHYGYTVRSLQLPAAEAPLPAAPPEHPRREPGSPEPHSIAPEQRAPVVAPPSPAPPPANESGVLRRELGHPESPPGVPGGVQDNGTGKCIVAALLLALTTAGGFLAGVAWYQDQNLRNLRDTHEQTSAQHKEVLKLHEEALKNGRTTPPIPAPNITPTDDIARLGKRFEAVEQKMDRCLTAIAKIDEFVRDSRSGSRSSRA